MCGIAGFNYEDKSLIKDMCDLIHHRGPDDSGYFFDTNVSLGMRRLSIIDLKTGSQPQHNEEGDLWIIFNGEIYNFINLRFNLEKLGHNFITNSDTEVILHAYEEWGENCLYKFRGQFVFCIYDLKKKELFLARDPTGLKPLYYYFDGNNFIFCSEIKGILCHNIIRKLNINSLNFYVSLGFTPYNETLFSGINKLPAASLMKFDLIQKKLSFKKYFDFPFSTPKDKTLNEYVKEFRTLIENSITMRLISDVPIGAYLSGGLDSSCVVAIMSKFTDKPIKTFSIGFEEGAPINELKYAQYVSDIFNTDHKEFIVKSNCYDILPRLVWHTDDLIADPAVINVSFMANLASENVKVVLTGDGADEIFAGYSERYWLYGKKYFKIIPKIIMSKLLKYYGYIPSQKLQIILSSINSSINEEDRFFRPLLRIKDIEKNLMLSTKTINVQNSMKHQLNPYIDIDKINQYIMWDLKYQLPNQYNIKTDRISMASSIEARVPFLDREIVTWSLSLPSYLKLNNSTEKFILKSAMKGILPDSIIKRKKLGFGTPVNFWLKTGMNEVSGDILEKLSKRRSIFNSYYISKIIKNRKSRLYQFRVWMLMVFELWYETFFEKEDLKPITY